MTKRMKLFRLVCFVTCLIYGTVVHAFQEYDFKVLNTTNKDQYVIKEIDRFYKAIELDDVEEVKKSEYKQYLKANIKSKYGNSAFVFAIQQNSQNIINFLLQDIDFNVNNENNFGENALMMASFKGNANLVKSLIDKRQAQVNKDGWSPIHYATIGGNLAIVNFLLQAGAIVDAPTPNETTALMLACRYGHIRIVRLLLDKGADLSAINQDDLTPIDFARMYNQTEIANGLESRWFKLYKTEYEPIIDNLPTP